MKVHLDYGHDGLDVELPERTQLLQMADTPGIEQVDAQLEAALAAPIGSPP
ncbi:MAG: hypothetical protein HOC74_29780, partial [Gemmatimonadetes bacterium]|nr:hypothetical protein [Gemmatimonadota bacterium]